jgi:hypothetical protein
MDNPDKEKDAKCHASATSKLDVKAHPPTRREENRDVMQPQGNTLVP